MSDSAFRIDPEVLAALSAGTRAEDDTGGEPELPTWQSLRQQIDGFYRMAGQLVPPHPDVRTETFTTRSADGAQIALHWFTARDAGEAAVVHAHGGARIAGHVALFAPYVAEYVARSGVSFLSVEYRLAPEVRGVAPTEDMFAGVQWLRAHAAEVGIDPARIAVAGDSAGAGLAAGAALLARERSVPLAGQLLVYPMLDDRVGAADPALEPFAEWVALAAGIGWDALLGASRGDDVPPAAAPARADELAGLARAYIEVGELDLFRDQSVAYATRLWHAGVSTELHVLPGATHGFDHWAPSSALAARAMASRLAFLRSL